jgi:hypothetical protein
MKRINALLLAVIPLILSSSTFAQPDLIAIPNPTTPVVVGPISYVRRLETPQLTLNNLYELMLPYIDYGNVPGLYQNAIIQYSPQDKSWRLARYNKGRLLDERHISKIEVIKTQERPIQVFLKISGRFPMGCGAGDNPRHRLVGNTFEVSMFDNRSDYFEPAPAAMHAACIAVEVPFEKVIALPVFNLEAGEYRYLVNGKLEGTFTLAADNVLP